MSEVNAQAYSVGNTTQITNALKVDILAAVKGFNSELSTLLEQFADENSPIVIDGVEYDADQKNTAGVQMLLQNRLQEIENVESTLLNIINIMFQLDKSAGQIGAGG